MTASLVYAWAGLRSRWRSWAALALVVGLAGGAVLALASGARRTASAYPRFLQRVGAPDARLFFPLTAEQLGGIRRLPGVAGVVVDTGLPVADPDLGGVALGRGPRPFNRFKVLSGRLPSPDRPDEVAVNFLAAEHRHLRVGSRLTVHFAPSEPGAPSPASTFRVVGIEAAVGEFPPHHIFSTEDGIIASPAFLDTPTGAAVAPPGNRLAAVAVRLRRPADIRPFLAAVSELTGGAPAEAVADQTPLVERSLRQQSAALWVLAIFGAVATTLLALQLLLRQAAEMEPDAATLGALGMAPWQPAAGVVVRAAAAGVTAVAVAALVAVAASPLLPLGTARIAEPDPGAAVNVAVLAAGAVAIVTVVVLAAAAASARTARRRPASVSAEPRPALPVPLVADLGLRLAARRGWGADAVPVRTALAAAVVGIAAVVGAATFGASLTRLLETPALYGVTFDADVGARNDTGDVRPLLAAVTADPDVEAVAIGFTGVPMQSGAVGFDAQATAPVNGRLEPSVDRGRLPRRPGEVLLGSATARALRARIGTTVRVTLRGLAGSQRLRVVGVGVLPPFTAGEQLGRGGAVTLSGIEAIAGGANVPPPSDLLVRFRPGVDRRQALDRLSQALGGPGASSIFPSRPPGDIASFGQERALPGVLAALVGLVAVAAVAQLLVASVRRRRRELAVLKTLGLVPRQLSGVIACEATAVGLAAAVVGLPLGVAAGRWLWTAVAHQVGVIPVAVVPWWLVAAVGPCVVLAANVVAAGPALSAGRTSAAAVLRTE
ncbi:MAG TPA: ABC transporter permease [Acidimicrobiales bacterium]|nr:ABC transporter permease [Acidimicrobiales bacterium]